MLKYFLACFIFFSNLNTVDAQCIYVPQKENRLSPIFGIGNSTFYGDVQNANPYLNSDLALSAGLQYRINRRLSLRSELMYFRISGSDLDAPRESGRLQRNLSFRADNFEWNAVASVDLLPIKKHANRPVLNPYIFGGIGIIYHQPKAFYQTKWHALRPLKTEGVAYSTFEPVIPFGLGLRVKVKPNMNILFEGGYRFTFTDYLDDVSTVYLPPSSFDNALSIALSNRTAELGLAPKPAGSRRGNPDSDDSYLIASVKVEILLVSPQKTKVNRRYASSKRR